MSSEQEIRLDAVLDWLEKGHISTTQAAARIDPENRQVMCFACKFRRQPNSIWTPTWSPVWLLAQRPKNGSVAAGRRPVHDRSLYRASAD